MILLTWTRTIRPMLYVLVVSVGVFALLCGLIWLKARQAHQEQCRVMCLPAEPLAVQESGMPCLCDVREVGP